MLFIGAIKNALVGGYQKLTLPRKIERLQRELEADLLVDLDGIKRFHARELLLLTELSQSLGDLDEHDHAGRLRLMETWLTKMNATIKEAEAALKKEPANKLDVATLAVNIQDLALNTIRELDQRNAQIAARLQATDVRLEALNQSLEQIREACGATERLGARLALGLAAVGLMTIVAIVLPFTHR
jgi:hypothetical protein